MMPPREFNCELRLAYSTKYVEHEDFLAPVLSLREQRLLDFADFWQPINELVHFWNTLQIKRCTGAS